MHMYAWKYCVIVVGYGSFTTCMSPMPSLSQCGIHASFVLRCVHACIADQIPALSGLLSASQWLPQFERKNGGIIYVDI
jgi:hypothetical protein